MNKTMKKYSRELRNNPTDTEKFLWLYLRKKQMKGLRFRRQAVIGQYIVDFVCFEKGIVVEVDGSQHAMAYIKDFARDQWLLGNGFKVLRFLDNEVFNNLTGVLETIWENCESDEHPHPTSPIQGEE